MQTKENQGKEKAGPFKFKVNNINFESDVATLAGMEIKNMGSIPQDDQLFLKGNGSQTDRLIANDEVVTLEPPGTEQFYSVVKSGISLTIIGTKTIPEAEYPKDLLVSDLIKIVIEKLGYAENGNYQLKLKGSTQHLIPTQTLKQAGLKDHDIIIFTDLGNGAWTRKP